MTPAGLRIGLVVGLAWEQVGGVQLVTRQLAKEFARLGHRVFILALGEERSERREQIEAGVQVRLIPTPAIRRGELHRHPEQETEATRWCADHGLDVIHLQHLSGFGLGLPVRLRELGVPVFWTLHDYWAQCPRGQMWHPDGIPCERVTPSACAPCWNKTWPLLGPFSEANVTERLEFVRLAALACDAVFFPSAAALEQAALDGVVAKTVPNADMLGHLQHNCRCEEPAATLKAVELAVGRAPQEVRVGVLGAIQPSKGVLQLARWITELDLPLQLEIHGHMEPYHGSTTHLGELRELIQASPRLKWKGTFDPAELPGILSRLDLVCVPSLWKEVFGLVAREAQLAGLPVFVSDRGGLPESGAHCLPAGDAEAWKGALTRFANEPEWRLELTRTGTPPVTQRAAAGRHLEAYAASL